MKDTYLKPETIINNFDTTDIITTSGSGSLTPSGWINGWY